MNIFGIASKNVFKLNIQFNKQRNKFNNTENENRY